jgi:hypothetical protein
MPAHETFQVLVDIWSGGCNPKLHYALPILFALEVSGTILSALGVHRRAHYAVIKEENDQAALKTRIDKAIEVYREGAELERREEMAEEKKEEGADERKKQQEEAEERDEEALSEEIRRTDTEIKRVQSKASRSIHFGPSFGFAFGTDSGDNKS